MSISTEIPKHVEDALTTHRRGFLKSAGLLVVSFATGGGALVADDAAQNRTAAQPAGPYPDPDFRQLDSWIVIHENNTATFYVGKTDVGQGTGTGFRQFMSDELDIAFDRDHVHHGQHGHYRRSGRIGRLIGHGKRFLADAARCRGGATGAARNGIGPPRSAGRSTRCQQRRDQRESRSLKTRYVRRTDRGKEVQCHADRRQCKCRHWRRQSEAGAGTQIYGRPLQRDDIPPKWTAPRNGPST